MVLARAVAVAEPEVAVVVEVAVPVVVSVAMVVVVVVCCVANSNSSGRHHPSFTHTFEKTYRSVFCGTNPLDIASIAFATAGLPELALCTV